MSAEKIVEINIRKLFESKLSIETYFILDCLVKFRQDLIEDYVKLYGKIFKFRFEELIKLGYIEIKDLNNIIFDNIIVTSKAIKLIGVKELDHDKLFKELKEIYPNKIKVKGGFRRLHTDLPRCKKIYREIVTSEEFHHKILNCIKLYIKEMTQSNSMEFLQALPAFLHQRNYEQYLEEVEQLDKNNIKISNTIKTNISTI